MTLYAPISSGVKTLLETGKLNYRSPKMLEILDYLTMRRGNKYTQRELRKNINVSMPTCCNSLKELLRRNLIVEVKYNTNRRRGLKTYATNISPDGGLRAKLDT